MAENVNLEEDSSILGILKNEDQSEREGSAASSVEALDSDSVERKARDKYNLIEVPTERKVREDIAKLGGQIQTAETHRVIEVQQGEAHPEHRTYDAYGSPVAAAVHDYDSDRVETRTVRGSGKDDAEVKKHNDSLKKIVDNIEKENKKANS